MDELTEFDRVITLFYDAAVDDAKWAPALESLADFVGGTGAGYVAANPATGKITDCDTVRVLPEFRDLYLEYYSAKEIRLPPAIAAPVGEIMTERQLLDPRVLRRSEIYGDLLLPSDVPHFMFAWLSKRRDRLQTIAVENSAAHGEFDADAQRRFANVVPHLTRALRMREALACARQAEQIHCGALDALPFGVVLLDRGGCVGRTSTPAQEILRGDNGLAVSNGRLRAGKHGENERLQASIRRAVAAASAGERLATGNTVLVHRTKDKRPVNVSVVPIFSPDAFVGMSCPAAMVMIVDPERSALSQSAAGDCLPSLTRAEALLAHALFSGSSLREAAGTLGRSINTCKTQLKAIYAKTGCRNHVDLAKLLLMSAMGRCLLFSLEVIT